MVKKRRRRRPPSRVVPPQPQPQPLEPRPDDVEEEDTGPVEPAQPKVRTYVVELPLRSAEILDWYAGAHRITADQAAGQILRAAVTSMKTQWRESRTGTTGGSARKGGELDRMLERKRPST